MSTPVRDARPPTMLLAMINPVMRIVLRTPAGRLAGGLALLQFEGRKSRRRYRVPVGWHNAYGEGTVFTPAPWRTNFAEGAPVTVWHRGRRRLLVGTLVVNPEVVAEALEAAFAEGASPRALGLNIDRGHILTRSDVTSVNRAMIRFEDQNSEPSRKRTGRGGGPPGT